MGRRPETFALSAKAHVLDAIGLAGLDRHGLRHGHAPGRHEMGTSNECRVLGFGTSMPAANAALVNGTLIHGLDFDDTHIGAIYHATAPALAAALCGRRSRTRRWRDGDARLRDRPRGRMPSGRRRRRAISCPGLPSNRNRRDVRRRMCGRQDPWPRRPRRSPTHSGCAAVRPPASSSSTSRGSSGCIPAGPRTPASWRQPWPRPDSSGRPPCSRDRPGSSRATSI